MAKFVQRRPSIEAVEYDGTRESAERVMAEFVRPVDSQLDEFRSFLKWPESKVQELTQYKWFWFDSNVDLDRPALLADGSERDTGYMIREPGLWLGYEGDGAGTGVTQYQQIPVGYVYTGWSLKPNWMGRKEFLTDWEPVEAAAT